ncbi:cation:H+ antiporter [Natronospira proteinivora]|uniref:Cation:H+ antiporter n=1 Tax=Natronospira proteinivora TaxID=1807133 RepID=A0ABT1G474_9GAMM|nr:calcium/sodium antiporter [Natronospira proteinivora]MCP1726080.1 cation:H+ antiporter [Natronospira proteinivora]
MLLFLLAIVGGFALTIWAADRFVEGAAATARSLGITPLVIGLTVMAIGTSAPEIAASALAALQGHPGLGVGNAVGSNIANIGLILGVTALIRPLTLTSSTLRRELPLLVLVTFLCVLFLANGQLERTEALLMFLLMVLALIWTVKIARNPEADDPMVTDLSAQVPQAERLGSALGQLALGLVVLLGAAQLLVWGAVGLAEAFGVSDLVIGLTIVAIGTSLPELATCIAAVLKRHYDLVLGNVLGSNLFNLLVVLPIPGLLAPGPLPDGVMSRDIPVMLGLTLLVVILARGFGGHRRITRMAGLTLLLMFIAYQASLFLTNPVVMR